MVPKNKFSETMRIDISPDVLKDALPTKRQKKHIVVTPNIRRRREGSRRRPGSDREELHHDLLNSLYDAAVVTDLDGDIVEVNWRAEEFLEFSADELVGANVLDLIVGAGPALVDTLLANLEDQRFTLIQAYCQRSDETVFPAEIAVNKLTMGDMRLCFFIRDVTRRHEAEEMLRTEHNAIQNAGNGIAITDLDGWIDYLNPALLALWGSEDPDELLGQDIRSLWPDPQSAQELIDLVLREDDRAWTCELQSVRPDGTTVDLQVSAACNRDGENLQTGMVFSFTDISDRRRALDAARQVERQRVMLESLGAACHHLGQPATVLMANVGLIRKRLEDQDAETLELVDSCQAAVERLSEILHKLNRVNEYRTTQYLQGDEDDAETVAGRILDIGLGAAPSPQQGNAS